MTARLRGMIGVHVEEADDIDLARLDDDGVGSPSESTPRARDDRFRVVTMPGSRAPGILGIPSVAGRTKRVDRRFAVQLVNCRAGNDAASAPDLSTPILDQLAGTFGVHAVVIPDSPTMDAATIAAREPMLRRKPGNQWLDHGRYLRRC